VRGHIRERSPGCWAIVVDIKDATGRRKRKWHAFKGTKRQAQNECTRLLHEFNTGTYVEPAKLTVEQHLRSRLAQWESAPKGAIRAKTAERYRELINNQIVPHQGARLVQKLKVTDIEAWHNTLAASGRKDGGGGLSLTTIRNAHRVLSKGLRDAAKFELVGRNVATLQRPPKRDDDDDIKEVAIVSAERIGELLDKLRGRAMYPKAVTALFTGLRRGELLALRWCHLDLDKKELQVREALEETKAHGLRVKTAKTKAGRRDIALPDIVVDVLREHRRAQLELRLQLGLGKLAAMPLSFRRLMAARSRRIASLGHGLTLRTPSGCLRSYSMRCATPMPRN
jgi:integrase